MYNPENQSLDIIVPQLDPCHTYNIRCYIDASNALWVVSPLYLRKYDISTMQLRESFPVVGEPYYSFLQNNGLLWLTGNSTISIFDTRINQYVNIPTAIKKHPLLSKAEIDYIHPYNDNCLLLNTEKDGMFCYNYLTNTIIQQNEKDFPIEVPSFKIKRMFTDSKKNLWIGSEDQGYVVSYHYKERFNSNNYLRSFLQNKSVIAVSTDTDGNLWIATLVDGLYRYDISKKQIDPVNITKLSPDESQTIITVNQILIDCNDKIWLTTKTGKVLECIYTDNELCVNRKYTIPSPMSISQDANNNIWIGTMTNCVYLLRSGKEDFETIQLFGNGYRKVYTFIPRLKNLNNGKNIIAAFNQPMVEINIDNKDEYRVEIFKDIEKHIKHAVFIPTVLFEDSQGDIWIGTVGNGLLYYNTSTQEVQQIEGTACADISSIEEDSQGNLWISTLYGLSKYDRTTKHISNYYEEDGIGGNQFYDRSSCKLNDGTLVFGGTHGLTFFNPINVSTRHNIPLLFEDLKIHNRLIKPGKGNIIAKHLSYNPDIELDYDQNGFSISFVALDYSEHERMHYYYKLEGFDQYWIDTNNNREAYYANLPAGHYTFKVCIMNNDQNVVEAENAIKVVVRPAPWRTWWAYTLYSLLIAGVVFLFFRVLFRIRQEKEQVRRAELEKEQEQRVNKMNMSFFANISHEFRTPLTMISGPVSQLCESSEIEGNNKELLYIIRQSVDRMLRLVNQLMDFNKLENDTLKLKVKRTDVIVELKRIIAIFDVNAKSKNIDFITTGIENGFLMWLDADKMDKITTNLLSNALKYTPSGGEIGLNFDVINAEEVQQIFHTPQEHIFSQYIKLEVCDSGIGIPEDQKERIFERYYQLNNKSVGTYNWGTGIGLYYARNLARLHHGTLIAGNRTDGQGALFTLLLPTSDEAYTFEERDDDQLDQGKAYPLQIDDVTEHTYYYDEEEEDDNLQKILVVDDDTEVVHYLKVLLSPTYKVICCFNAKDALKAVNEEAPDLVLSDVVMPGTDGYTLCRRIKEDIQLCHTPVVLVTAKTNMEDQVEGLNTGADAYVTKPFDPTYLQALIKSQLKNREKVRTLLSCNTQTDTIDDNVLSPQDNVFMTELYRLMENELSNPELDISHMTELLKISRTKFYYKVKGLTGENPGSFFKTYKLNRAAELIKEGKYSISEIADMTGFSTHSYFSKAFRKQFGIAPSKYK